MFSWKTIRTFLLYALLLFLLDRMVISPERSLPASFLIVIAATGVALALFALLKTAFRNGSDESGRQENN